MANYAPSLEERIQALAQELQDMILDFTIAVETHRTIIIDDNYRPPTKQLSINRKTRTKLAQEYYGTNSFTWAIQGSPPPPTAQKMCLIEWLPMLSTEHRAMLRELRMFVHYTTYQRVFNWRPTLAQQVETCIEFIDTLGNIMNARGIELDQEIVKMNLTIKTRTVFGEERVEEKWMTKKELLEMVF